MLQERLIRKRASERRPGNGSSSRGRTSLAALLLLSASASAAFGAGSALPVSPGTLERVTSVPGRCPTFSWTAVEGASGYQLKAFLIDESGLASQKPALEQTLPRAASSWTPDADRCLETNRTYGWTVRGLTGGADEGWSEPAVFRVPEHPLELEEALSVVQEYLRQEGLEETGPEENRERAAEGNQLAAPTGVSSHQDAGSPAPSAANAAGVGGFSVDALGNATAATFTGDGGGLTNVGIRSVVFSSGLGASPTGTTRMFVAEPVPVTVEPGEEVLIHSYKGLGSTAVGGAASLNLWVCYRLADMPGDIPTNIGAGIFGLRVTEDSRYPFGLSAKIAGLDGSYVVGLCADANNDTGWNSNERSYTTAVVYRPTEP